MPIDQRVQTVTGVPDTEVSSAARQAVAAERAATAHEKVATSQNAVSIAATTNAVSNSNMAIAHAGIKTAADVMAAQLTKSVAEDEQPYRDHEVWLRAAASRAVHPDRVVSSLPEVAVFADRMLLEFRKRYPRTPQQ